MQDSLRECLGVGDIVFSGGFMAAMVGVELKVAT